MYSKRAQLAAKIESVEGTAETLAGTDVVEVANLKFTPNDEEGKRPSVSSSLSPWASVMGKYWGRLEFDVPLKGSGAAGTAPAIGKFFKGAGFAETVVSGASVVYEPASSAISSLTLAGYVDGVVRKIWGARADWSIAFIGGQPVWVHFVYDGAAYSVADAALLSSGVSYEDTDPQAFLAASLTYDSYAAICSRIDIKGNNTVAMREDVNQASGYKSAAITGRELTFSLDPEMVTVATYDFFGKMRANTQAALAFALGATAGNIVSISVPKGQPVKPTPGNRNDWETLGMDFRGNRNSGDDEISIIFS